MNPKDNIKDELNKEISELILDNLDGLFLVVNNLEKKSPPSMKPQFERARRYVHKTYKNFLELKKKIDPELFASYHYSSLEKASRD